MGVSVWQPVSSGGGGRVGSDSDQAADALGGAELMDE